VTNRMRGRNLQAGEEGDTTRSSEEVLVRVDVLLALSTTIWHVTRIMIVAEMLSSHAPRGKLNRSAEST
jgi:hypothetical protein